MAKTKSSSGERHVLSKTSFIKSLQCQKQLYLYKKHYFLRDRLTPKQLAIFSRGHSVGKRAWELFPNGINAAPKSSMQYEKALALTQQLIFQKYPIIYEASFRFNQCLSILDILTNHGGKLEAYEVKSSLSITETYLMDAAFQYYVMQGSGYAPKRFSLIIVNKDYLYSPDFKATDYFVTKDITEQVVALQPLISERVKEAKHTINLSNSPIIELGLHCETPYKCDFVGFCRKKLPQPNVFSLTDIPAADQYALYSQQKVSLDQISDDDLKSASAKIQLFTHKDKQIHLDLPEMSNIVPNTAAYWIWESPAMPIIENHTPYMSMLLGVAIKKLNRPNSIEFLFLKKDENYTEFIAQVKKIVAENNMVSYDVGDYSSIFNVEKAPVDLLEWVKEKRFYHPGIMGNYELSHVVSTCLPKAQFSNSNGKISHEEFLKAELLKAMAEERTVSNEALLFLKNQLLKIESLWNFLMEIKS